MKNKSKLLFVLPFKMTVLIYFCLLCASTTFALDEARSKRYSGCFREATKQKLKEEALGAFMNACTNPHIDIPADNQRAGREDMPSPGLRGGNFSCGGAKVEFKFLNSTIQKNGVESVMEVSRGERTTVLRYDMNIDFIGGTCVPDAQGRPTIVFQAYCGGSGCYDLDNWGIIDSSDLRVLLVPNTWNRKDARRILGRGLPQKIEMISIANEAEKLLH